MAILNYTTSVPAQNSIGEITSLLVRKGAQSITQEYYEDGRVKSVSFTMRVGIIPVRFELPANTSGVLSVMLKDKPYNSRTRGTRDQYIYTMKQQAERVTWRILKDWVEAQMALIESGQAEPAQVFMPYATEKSGQTMYQIWTEQTQLALPSETL